jgi:hypothetical protein
MPSVLYMLSAASEKLQINFRRSLWSSMLGNVTMPSVIAAAAKPHQRHSKEEEKSLDIKKFESFCSFQSSSSIGLGRHAFPGVGANSSSSI